MPPSAVAVRSTPRCPRPSRRARSVPITLLAMCGPVGFRGRGRNAPALRGINAVPRNIGISDRPSGPRVVPTGTVVLDPTRLPTALVPDIMLRVRAPVSVMSMVGIAISGSDAWGGRGTGTTVGAARALPPPLGLPAAGFTPSGACVEGRFANRMESCAMSLRTAHTVGMPRGHA